MKYLSRAHHAHHSSSILWEEDTAAGNSKAGCKRVVEGKRGLDFHTQTLLTCSPPILSLPDPAGGYLYSIQFSDKWPKHKMGGPRWGPSRGGSWELRPG